jgi:aspartate/methionine/tyrosine aminotransferase
MLESAVGAVGYVIRKLNQVRENDHSSQSRFEAIEIIEALILALVAVATAWSGYQAAKWAGNRAEQYAKASRLRVTAEGLATLAGQERIYDSDTFNSWLAAKLDGKEKATEFFQRRFRDEYRPAFAAWLSTDPFNNAQAPPGPIFMPDYHNAKHEQFLGLSKQAAVVADQGTKSGETGDQYVRITVLLATVLLITAIGQRFHFKAVRVVFMILAWLLLCLPLWQLLTLPRI